MLKEEFQKYINSLNIKSCGSVRTCYVSEDGKTVYLKQNADSDEFKNLYHEKNYHRRNLITTLINDDINIAPIIGGFVGSDGFYYEIQEAGAGKVLGSFLQPSIKHFVDLEKIKNLPEDKQLYIIKEARLKYNQEMKNQLINAPQSHYDKIISDLFKLKTKYNLEWCDNHPENILYDPKKGFTIIDFDDCQYKYLKDTFDVLTSFISILQDLDLFYFVNYKCLMSFNAETNAPILKKIVQAAVNNNLEFSDYQIQVLTSYINNLTPSHLVPDIINIAKSKPLTNQSKGKV